jgi:hypothetical protein
METDRRIVERARAAIQRTEETLDKKNPVRRGNRFRTPSK